MAVQVALAVQQEIAARLQEADQLRRQEVERARYEAESARQRYMLVDPLNRLVARSLEADWNDKLGRWPKPMTAMSTSASWISRCSANPGARNSSLS